MSSPVSFVSFRVSALHVQSYVDALDEVIVADALSCFEIPPGKEWEISFIAEAHLDLAAIELALSVLSQSIGDSAPLIHSMQLPSRDWVSEVQKQFVPIHAGRFFIHAAHYAEVPPFSKHVLCVDPGRAFGTGTHPTTYSCLRAFDDLLRTRSFTRILDVGTGSGILAMAAASALPSAFVYASDNDPIAVQVARENARINGLHRRIRFAVAPGYRHALIRAQAPYDLIFCNILSRPLITLAPSLARHLAPGGVAILSGLLDSQANEVLAVHRGFSLTLRDRIQKDEWVALVIS